MKILLTIILTLFSFISYSQEYPRIELNQRGEKVVVFSLGQAQKIDNNLEILALIEKSKIQCDSLNIQYVRVVDSQSRQIAIQDRNISELKAQVKDKDLQIENLSSQVKNIEESNKICEEQKCIKDKQIDGLQRDLKKEKIKKWIAGGAGLLLGILTLIAIQ